MGTNHRRLLRNLHRAQTARGMRRHDGHLDHGAPSRWRELHASCAGTSLCIHSGSTRYLLLRLPRNYNARLSPRAQFRNRTRNVWSKPEILASTREAYRFPGQAQPSARCLRRHRGRMRRMHSSSALFPALGGHISGSTCRGPQFLYLARNCQNEIVIAILLGYPLPSGSRGSTPGPSPGGCLCIATHLSSWKMSMSLLEDVARTEASKDGHICSDRWVGDRSWRTEGYLLKPGSSTRRAMWS
jgi:hypothetical protein